MTQPLPQFGPEFPDRKAIAEMLSIDEAEIAPDLPLEVVSCGLPLLFVPLKDLGTIRQIKLRHDVWEKALKDFAASEVFVFTGETEREGSTVHSRMFAPALGIAEDPATGAASGPLGCYLVRHGLVKPDEAHSIVSEQGFEMGRPSMIHIEIDVEGEQITGVRVGGRNAYIGQGTIQLEGI
jgi:trans-2,3-dihydro-3-hydroxyanthranilate isomerase